MTSSSIPLTMIYVTISDLFITVYNCGSIVPLYPHSSNLKYLFIFIHILYKTYSVCDIIAYSAFHDGSVNDTVNDLLQIVYQCIPISYRSIYRHAAGVNEESTKRNTLCLKSEFNVDCCSDRMNFYSSASESLSRGTKTTTLRRVMQCSFFNVLFCVYM